MLVAIVVAISVVMWLLRQPLIIGYLVTGILASVFGLIRSAEALSAFSQFGVALLLFMVGLGLNPHVIRDVGKISVITGVGQVLFTSIIGFALLLAMGFPALTSAYVSVALAFSSTIIIIKLLTDKQAADTLYGRVAIGFLIIQDVIALLILLAVSSSASGNSLTAIIVMSLGKGTLLLGVLYAISTQLLPWALRRIARSQELLFLFSIGWAFAVAAAFTALGLSMEIGALLAGMALSFSTYRIEIGSRLKPLRDFFIMIFFIYLGTQMQFGDVLGNLLPILVLSVFVLIGNPLIVMTLMGLLGHTSRNSFLAGLTVAQISEFSLILIGLGISVGHVTPEVLSIVTMVGILTIAGSTYFITYGEKIYGKLSLALKIFERRRMKEESTPDPQEHADTLLFGYNRIGFDLLNALHALKRRFLVIDYDPEVIAKISSEGIACRYGDAADPELLDEIDFKNAKMVISTIPDADVNSLLIRRAKGSNSKVIVMVVSHQIDDALRLYTEGADYVIMPHFLGGHHAATMIQEYGLEVERFVEARVGHIAHLRRRKSIGQEHPRHAG